MVVKDPYVTQGRLYDRLIEPSERRVRRICLEMCPPKPGMRVMDVGFGTGTHLDFYKRAGCMVSGVDTSPTMFSLARKKLGSDVDLRRESAACTSYDSDTFDLVTIMFVLHEMPPDLRPLVLSECGRIVKRDGTILVADYHDGPRPFPMGQVWKGLIVAMEIFGGREHFANFRHFEGHRGIPALVQAQQLQVTDQWISREGVVAVFLLKRLE